MCTFQTLFGDWYPDFSSTKYHGMNTWWSRCLSVHISWGNGLVLLGCMCLTAIHIMDWCQTKSHYLNQYWPRSVAPYGITAPQWGGCIGHILQIKINLEFVIEIAVFLLPFSSYHTRLQLFEIMQHLFDSCLYMVALMSFMNCNNVFL